MVVLYLEALVGIVLSLSILRAVQQRTGNSGWGVDSPRRMLRSRGARRSRTSPFFPMPPQQEAIP